MNAPDKSDVFFPFDNSYARLPDRFFARLDPVPVPEPRLIRLNTDLARLLRLDPAQLTSPSGVEVLAGNRVPEGSDPLAMAYAGHQFGNWVPQLGDGRAILLGEVIGNDGVRRDIQLKGSGRTPFSRMGDGRAVLGPILREYIVAEGMAALGVPTTRALAAVLTGEKVAREEFLPGAVLTRVAQSHVRVGTFQFFAARQDDEALKLLADHVIKRHYPDAAKEKNPYLSLLENVVARQAQLVARWQLVGFIHGVMNTDNMSIAGETIDYGPCAFMDTYHPNTVYSSIDHMGRYAYSNQPGIAHWNLAVLAQSLLPLFDADQDKAVEMAQSVINAFPALYDEAYLSGLLAKLGLTPMNERDKDLADDLLTCMAENEADFTLTFRTLCEAATLEPTDADGPVRDLFKDGGAFDAWAVRWRKRLLQEKTSDKDRKSAMRTVNPAFIPRNHLIAEAIEAAEERDDFAPFEELMTVLSKPYEDQPGRERYTRPPRPDQIVHRTFCGT
ncbi:MAG: YdiU family protein [Hyphomicrobiaceae bacterium]|nr:YdiU family protein [Hyphomicrobiaceae bacterium]